MSTSAPFTTIHGEILYLLSYRNTHTIADMDMAISTTASKWLVRIALAGILLVALAFRLFFGLDWDDGALFHPDERAIILQVTDCLGWDKTGVCEGREVDNRGFTSFLSAEQSPINPGWFNYGSLPLYILKVAETVTGMGYPDLYIPGRIISSIAGILTVLLTYALGSLLFSRKVGLLAAAFSSLAVISIQQNHFLTVDSLLTFFVAACVYFSVLYAKRGRVRYFALASGLFGLALATKFAALPLAFTPFVAHIVVVFGTDNTSRKPPLVKSALIAGITGILAFVLAQPYAILDAPTFLRDVTMQSSIVRMTLDVPFTRQYINTTPYLYQVMQLGLWGLGPVLGLLSWLGLLFGIIRAAALRHKGDLVVAAWVLPYFVITGAFGVKFLRYLEPITPFMFVYGTALILFTSEALGRLIAKYNHRLRFVAFFPIAIILVFTLHYALSFTSIYTQEHPALKASEWISANAPEGSLVAKEHWEESIPLEYPRVRYAPEELPLYDEDSPFKFQKISDTLAQSDYLVLYSNRLYGTIPRLSERYPISTRYYESLFGGELGYRLVFNTTNHIRFAGITFYEDPFARVNLQQPHGFSEPEDGFLVLRMGWADESFSVYDHPNVMIFENTGEMSADEIFAAIGISDFYDETARSSNVGLLLTDDELAAHRSGRGWGAISFLQGTPHWIVWLPWLAAIYLLGIVAAPLSFALFRFMPEASWLWAKILGLLVASVFTWLLVSLGIAEFSLVSVWAGILVLAGFSAASAFWLRKSILSFFRQKWRTLILFDLLFLLAFAGFLMIRAANPDLWHSFRGGEKPMDFAYLNAVISSVTMPAYDPWFAFGRLNYYYFGQFIVGWLVRLTGIETSVAYNLAIPALFSFTVAAAFSLGYGLTKLLLQAKPKNIGGHTLKPKPMLIGLLCAVLVAVSGNVDGFLQFVGLSGESIISGGEFDYWASSRIISTDPPGYEITEFPFFTFLYGDLHAHMIVIPVAMISLALAISAGISAYKRRRFTFAQVAAAGFAAGSLRAINTWDFPVQTALGVFIIAAGVIASRNENSPRKLVRVAGLVILFLVVGYIVFYPFNSRIEIFSEGVVPAPTQTPLWQYMVIYLPFIFVSLSWVAVKIAGREWSRGGIFRLVSVPIGLLALIVGLLLPQWATASFSFALAALMGSAALLLFRGSSDRDKLMALPALLAACAFFITGAVELVSLEGDLGRQNSVFKFYIQVWWLLGVSSAVMAWDILGRVKAVFGSHRLAWKQRILPLAWPTALAVLVAATLVYPAFAIPARLSERFDPSFVSLDGAAYMERVEAANIPGWCFEEGPVSLNLSEDYAAIQWLRENAEGFSVIAEGLMPEYCWGNRFSVYTGLPSVIGWQRHQTQQREAYAWEVLRRRESVNNFYSSPSLDFGMDFMIEFDVRYVIVGGLERAVYPSEGLEKFEIMSDRGDIKGCFQQRVHDHIRKGRRISLILQLPITGHSNLGCTVRRELSSHNHHHSCGRPR